MNHPEKLFQLSIKETFIRLYVLELIIEHLANNINDPRKKERLRSELARKTIGNWLKEGCDLYEKNGYSKFITDKT